MALGEGRPVAGEGWLLLSSHPFLCAFPPMRHPGSLENRKVASEECGFWVILREARAGLMV